MHRTTLLPMSGLTQAAGMPCRLSGGGGKVRAVRGRRGTAALRRRAGLVAGVASAVALGASGGSAYAWFQAQSTSSATARVANPATVTVAAASAGADLLPGGTGAAVLTLQNTNPFAVTFGTVTSASVVSNDTAVCPSANVGIAKTAPYTLPSSLTVAAGSTSGALSIAGFVRLSASAPTGCQGVGFTLTLTLSGRQS